MSLPHRQIASSHCVYNSIPKLICKLGYTGIDLHMDAINISTTFKELFSKYAKCHQLLNTRENFNDDEIKLLVMSQIIVCTKPFITKQFVSNIVYTFYFKFKLQIFLKIGER